MKNIFNKINGTITLLYGASGLVSTAICAYFAIRIITRMVTTGEFSWGGFIGILLIVFVVGFIGYSLLSVGLEQFRK